MEFPLMPHLSLIFGIVMLILVLLYHMVTLGRQSQVMSKIDWYLDLVANATINQLSPNGALDGLQQLPIGSFNKMEFGMEIFIACGLIYRDWMSGIYTRSRAISSS